jgi:hypothetical protein
MHEILPSGLTYLHHKVPHLAFSYGLFARMTTQRLEIILEGSYDGTEWKPYHFKFKPGNLMRAPPFVGTKINSKRKVSIHLLQIDMFCFLCCSASSTTTRLAGKSYVS